MIMSRSITLILIDLLSLTCQINYENEDIMNGKTIENNEREIRILEQRIRSLEQPGKFTGHNMTQI